MPVADMAIEASPTDFELSIPDIAYLTGLFGGGYLLGLDNPYEGLSYDEVRGELEKAGESLRERRVISVSADGTVSISDPNLSLAIAAIAWPDCTMIVSRRENGSEMHKLFHMSKYFSAWHKFQMNGEDITLHLLANISRAGHEILASLGLPESNSTAQGEAFSCSVEELASLLDGSAVARLACLDRRGGLGGGGSAVAFMFREDGLWEILPDSSEAGITMNVIPTSSGDASGNVRRMVWEYLPELALRMF